ncbi:MAG: hypothetical protein ACRCZY_06390 [Phocaeicola sp.]
MMKKFFGKIILFLIAFSLALVPISIFCKQKLEAFLLEKSALDSNATVLAIGDSHIEYSLDPALFPEMTNRGFSAEWLFYTLPKLEYYLNHNKQIKTVLLGYSAHSLSKELESAILGEKSPVFYNKYMPLIVQSPSALALYHKYALNKESFLFYLQAKYRIPSKQFVNNLTNKSDIFKGGFIKQLKVMKAEQSVNFHLGDLDTLITSPILEESLQQIIALTKRKNVNLVLYNAPCHENHPAKNTNFIRNYINQVAFDLCKNEGIHYINHFDYHLPDSMYCDYDHINYAGAKVITPLVRDTLIKLGIVEENTLHLGKKQKSDYVSYNSVLEGLKERR